MAIYVNFEIPDSPKDFLERLFSYSETGDTVYSIETYKDKECTEEQCPKKKYRSFDDLLELINTYYKVEEKELMHLLLVINIEVEGSPRFPWFVNCTDIYKPTLNYYISFNKNDIFKIFEEDIENKMFNSEYNWYSLFQLLGINNQKELEEYVKGHKSKEYNYLKEQLKLELK